MLVGVDEVVGEGVADLGELFLGELSGAEEVVEAMDATVHGEVALGFEVDFLHGHLLLYKY